ncbi:MAG: hypothetical protein JNN01_16850 [Opitutaceae bacterium]|nr:hypothetical protein [Opitutaceae bacterium]
MKVTFTSKEYAKLLELVHFGLHVVKAYHGPEHPGKQRYAELEQKVYELAVSLGCADLVEAAAGGGLQVSAKLAHDERVEKTIFEFTNDAFWHELVARLADRDCSAQQARNHLAQATPGVEPPPSLEEQVQAHEDLYWAEFQKHDLNHVVVLRARKG